MGNIMVFTILYGAITHHYLSGDLDYCKQINNYGTINNEYVVAMAGNKDWKAGFISGTDSACGRIFGPVFEITITNNLSFVLGGYNTNVEEFHKRNIEPIRFGNITPIIGVNYSIDLYKNDQFALKINNLISVDVISHSIGVTF
jgi:hypothetical protein